MTTRVVECYSQWAGACFDSAPTLLLRCRNVTSKDLRYWVDLQAQLRSVAV